MLVSKIKVLISLVCGAPAGASVFLLILKLFLLFDIRYIHLFCKMSIATLKKRDKKSGFKFFVK